MSSYFWAPALQRDVTRRAKAGVTTRPAERMRKLITSREEADAVYLGFPHTYNRQGLVVVELCGLYKWLETNPGYFVPLEGEGGERFCGRW